MIDNDEQFAFLAFATNQCSDIDTTLRDTACNRRAQLLLAQHFAGLSRQRLNLFGCQSQCEQLLPCGFELDTRILISDLCAQILVLADDLSFEQGFGTIEQLLLQLEQ